MERLREIRKKHDPLSWTSRAGQNFKYLVFVFFTHHDFFFFLQLGSERQNQKETVRYLKYDRNYENIPQRFFRSVSLKPRLLKKKGLLKKVYEKKQLCTHAFAHYNLHEALVRHFGFTFCTSIHV